MANYSEEIQITDRAVADRDTVNIDFVGSVDGVPFENGSTNGMGEIVTIGVTNYIDDFLQQLIGHKPGDSFDINVTFPEEYGDEDLNGKDAVFATTINHIIETKVPELNDNFVSENFSSVYGYDTVTGMKKEIENELQRSAMSFYLQEYLLDNSTIKSLPENLLDYQENSMIQFYKGNADSYQISLDEFLSTYMQIENVEELCKVYLDDNKRAASSFLVTQAIAEDSNITVTDDDVANYFKKYMGSEDYSPYMEYYGMPYLKLITLNQSVMDHIIDNSIKG